MSDENSKRRGAWQALFEVHGKQTNREWHTFEMGSGLLALVQRDPYAP